MRLSRKQKRERPLSDEQRDRVLARIASAHRAGERLPKARDVGGLVTNTTGNDRSCISDSVTSLRARKVIEAYDDLIATLYWERDRVLRWAEQIAAEYDEESANRMLAAQAAYIREQAIR